MRLRLGIIGLFVLALAGVSPVVEAAAPITYRYLHHIFTIYPDQHPTWKTTKDMWLYNGRELEAPATWKVDGDSVPPLPAGVTRQTLASWNTEAIRRTLSQKLSAALDRPAGTVTIKRSSGAIIFDGVGLTGREVDLDLASALTISALEKGVTTISIPVEETQPQITVLDQELVSQGIKEVVTVGESNFVGSPVNRRHNIKVGLEKFNGHLIPQGSTFSFVETLGPVNGTTGYRKELVIKGDKTEPDYGGGLCQVSTTAYRGAWEYGFPIVARRNHSYAVSYYGPQGSDATVYPGSADMQFLNDGPSALLMQTYQEDDHAYFIYYGTKDTRESEVYGPLVLSTRAAPPDKTVFTTDLAPGEKRKVGDRHPGMTTLWFRLSRPGEEGEKKVERVLSIYEARPLYYEVGIDPNALPVDVNTTEPPRTF